MEQCAFCGAPGEFDAVHAHEMVRVCRACAEKERIPILRRATPEQILETEKSSSLRERLARMSGTKSKIMPLVAAKQVAIHKFGEKAKPAELAHLGLEDNFYWHLMRARRARGLTTKQLALAIQEPEQVVLQLEQGQLPANASALLHKIEDLLKMSLRRKKEETQGKVLKVTGNKESLMGTEVEFIEEADDFLVDEK